MSQVEVDSGRELANMLMRAAATPANIDSFVKKFNADPNFRDRIEMAVNYHLVSIATDDTGMERHSRFTRIHDIYRKAFEKLGIAVECEPDASIKRHGRTAGETGTILLPLHNQFSDSKPSLYWLHAKEAAGVK